MYDAYNLMGEIHGAILGAGTEHVKPCMSRCMNRLIVLGGGSDGKKKIILRRHIAAA